MTAADRRRFRLIEARMNSIRKLAKANRLIDDFVWLAEQHRKLMDAVDLSDDDDDDPG